MIDKNTKKELGKIESLLEKSLKLAMARTTTKAAATATQSAKGKLSIPLIVSASCHGSVAAYTYQEAAALLAPLTISQAQVKYHMQDIDDQYDDVVFFAPSEVARVLKEEMRLPKELPHAKMRSVRLFPVDAVAKIFNFDVQSISDRIDKGLLFAFKAGFSGWDYVNLAEVRRLGKELGYDVEAI